MLLTRSLIILTVALAALTLEKAHAFTVISSSKGSYHNFHSGPKSLPLRAVPIDLGGLDMTPTTAAAFAAVVGGIALAIKGASSSSEKDPTSTTTTRTLASNKASKIDLSIPYDSAARLAYDQWRSANGQQQGGGGGGAFNEATYKAFQTKYETLTVANVIAKKMERDMAAMAPPKVDLSIPYDSAARLAYDQWRSANGQEGGFDEANYKAFQTKYETLTVANVIAKKMKRDMAAMAGKEE